MNRFLLCLLLILLPFLSAAQISRISGKSKAIASSTLVFYTINDPVLKLENTVLKIETDTSGFFTANIPAENTQLLWCRIGPWNTYIFAEPGMNYTVELPDISNINKDYLLNPFFEAASLHLSIEKAGLHNSNRFEGMELNQAIREFDSRLEAFLDVQLVRYYAPDQANASLDSFLAVAFTPVQVSDQNYFDRYRQLGKSYLEFLSGRISAESLVNDLFSNQNPDYSIPLCTELFQLIFGSFFNEIVEQEGFRMVFQRLNQGSLHHTIALIRENALLSDARILEFVLLDQIYKYYYKGGLSKHSLIDITDSLRISSSSEQTRFLAAELKVRFTKLSPGSMAPSFKVKDKNGVMFQPESYFGKYLILNFCNAGNVTCLREFEYLKIMLANFGENLQVITFSNAANISFPDEYNNLSNWLFLQPDPEILLDYDVRAIPYFILIDDEGKILLAPAPMPTEGLDRELFHILRSQGKL